MLLQQMCQYYAGNNVRHAFVFNQLAVRVCKGNFAHAREALTRPYDQLDGLTPLEAVDSDVGMLQLRSMICEMEWRANHPGIRALMSSYNDQETRDLKLLVALLPRAWGLSESEFAQLLEIPDAALLDDIRLLEEGSVYERAKRLVRLLEAFRAVLKPSEFPAAWNTVWEKQSPIGRRSLWQAFQEDGDAALNKVEVYLWLVAEWRSAQRKGGKDSNLDNLIALSKKEEAIGLLREGVTLHPVIGDRSAIAALAFAEALANGDVIATARWMTKYANALGGTPTEISEKSDEGLQRVLTFIAQIEHGVYI